MGKMAHFQDVKYWTGGGAQLLKYQFIHYLKYIFRLTAPNTPRPDRGHSQNSGGSGTGDVDTYCAASVSNGTLGKVGRQ